MPALRKKTRQNIYKNNLSSLFEETVQLQLREQKTSKEKNNKKIGLLTLLYAHVLTLEKRVNELRE